jgi:hypothetical protein
MQVGMVISITEESRWTYNPKLNEPIDVNCILLLFFQ